MADSRIENQLDALINGSTYSENCESRTEEILQSIIDKTEYTEPAESRIEQKLLDLKEQIGKMGSGNGVGLAVGILDGTANAVTGILREVTE